MNGYGKAYKKAMEGVARYKASHDLRGFYFGKVANRGHGWTHVTLTAYAAAPITLRVHDDGRVQRLWENCLCIGARGDVLRNFWQ